MHCAARCLTLVFAFASAGFVRAGDNQPQFGVEKFVFETAADNSYFPLITNGLSIQILTDEADFKGVLRAAADLREDFRRVSGHSPKTGGNTAIIAGTAGNSHFIDKILKDKRLANEIIGKREKFIITLVEKPAEGIDKALVIAGSDKRGTIYGIYELSQQAGISPWYWWADVPVVHRENLYFKPGIYTDGEPAIALRGIFINDEAPAFQGWCEEKFGGVNAKMYQHIFELILRLKGNFFWPAMWGNAFYDDDPQNGILADEMGIVIGTSHHEPLGRAHDEWRRYGKGVWNYEKNADELQKFWQAGIERNKDWEKVVTVGMRGDGDEPMSQNANIALLERIISDQRKIIADVTGKPAEQTPQVWALYKEVQDYYDQGMRVPDDVTLLLSDDNWGNVRKLPAPGAPRRKGGYGMYYHVDYVGAPRNYKWLNVSQIQRIWEQMNLTYSHGVDRLWVLNVGDLKPMEFPISFFLAQAWNPARFKAKNLEAWTEQWCAQQFGQKFAAEAARLLNLQARYASRVTPEMLNERTFSLENYGEFETAVSAYKALALDAFRFYNRLPAEYRDAFDELVLFPINAVCNLYEMYYALAMNRQYSAVYDLRANEFADKVKECFVRDSLLTEHYNREIADGKWAHQMDQIRIGYTSWQQPDKSIMPKVEYVPTEAFTPKTQAFAEKDGYVSVEAENFARSAGTDKIKWEIIPWLGRTKSAVTTFPQNVYPTDKDLVYLEYDFQTVSEGKANVTLLLAPTLNFNANKGLRYALSIDGGKETTVNFNGQYSGELGRWQGERIIWQPTEMEIGAAGRHTLRIRVLEPGIVFEKIIIDFGGLKPSYLGPPESEMTRPDKIFPDFPPATVSTKQDHDQMMEQLGLKYPVIKPESDDRTRTNKPKAAYEGHTRRTSYGLWNNYLQSWEPEGDYWSGAKFYPPLPLHNLDGLTANTWETRRAKIFDEIQKIYGYIPADAAKLKIDWNLSEPTIVKEVFGRDFKPAPTTPFREYRLTGKIDVSSYPAIRHAPLISGILRLPADLPEGKKAPVVILISWSFGGRLICDEDLWKTMSEAGFGVLYFDPVALQPDNGESLTDYLIGLVNKGNWRKPTDWGTLVAWGWGVSRIIDFFETSTLVDASKIALTGHSRYGKATLVAMAYDRRIAVASPSSSGAMGISQSRRHLGEDLENCVWDSEYHWTAGNAMIYAGVDESSKDGYLPRKVLQMPVDAESLVALCAPRPLFVGCGSDTAGDAWADPYGHYLTAAAASPVYQLLGKQGLVMNDTMDYRGQKIPYPVTDKAYLQGEIGFRRHAGGHDAAPNYPTFKEFLLKYWK
ncbi:MAG: glycosyl hydrolase 115 family protein [Dysgonamonadaceae bacterium]|nr:glycosyl hydrolase 115 family protein [Dysgonamonadaceae bacterium]